MSEFWQTVLISGSTSLIVSSIVYFIERRYK